MDSTQLFWTQIGAGVSTLIFAGMLFQLFRLRGKIDAATRWTPVEGVVIASEIETPSAHVSDDQSDSTPIVRDRYQAGGRAFEGNRIRIGGEPMTTRMDATRLAARYPVGATVDVHVDPGDPQNAVLDPSQAGNLVAQSVLAVTFGVIAAVLLAHAFAGRVIYAGNGVPMFALLLPALAFIAAAAGLLSFLRARRLAQASLGWPTAAGRITSSKVIEEWVEDTRDEKDSRVRKKPRYQVDLRYAYRVGRRDFVGVTPGWGWTGIYGLRDPAEKEAGQYRVGADVTVHYDPHHPANAVIDPAGKQGATAPLVFAAACIVVGAILSYFMVVAGF